MHKIAVIIPCYNEAVTIARVVHDFRAALPNAEIFVYDNNSSDDTSAIAKKAGACVRHCAQQGKGNTIRKAFLEVDADCYLMVDGDDACPAEQVAQMARLVLEEGVDMVIGDRLSTTYFSENKRAFHNVGNRLVCRLVNILFARKNEKAIHDIMAGYRACSRIFVASFPILSSGFELETAMTIHALDRRFTLREIGVEYRDRPQGSVSKLNTFKDGAKVMLMIFNLFRHYKPLLFFGYAALGFFGVATFLFIPIWAEYLLTHAVPRFPTLIASGFFASCGLLSFVCGLILDAIVKNNKERFELALQNLYKGKKS
ncbi:MAG: glycosyltransferase family 2 protein [Candidatus Accumulibacter sp.]|jgi:glycosyltransferase involved in cell wall biosynthesis|nr:glycosyltransferase family 2 protein [Accumulibacter sp.]